MQQGEEHGGVGLRPYRYPLGGARAGHRQVGLELHPRDAPGPGLGVAVNAGDAAGGVAVVTEGQHEIASRGVRGDGEGAVPELAVEMLGVVALHALTAADPLIHGSPGGEERREGPEVGGRDAAGAERGRQPRISRLVGEPLGPDGHEPIREHVERLVPRHGRPARIFVPALAGVGPPHRALDTCGVVELLDQAVGSDTDLAARRMYVGEISVGLDADGHAVLDEHLQQIGTRDTLVAVHGDFLDGAQGRHLSARPRLWRRASCARAPRRTRRSGS